MSQISSEVMNDVKKIMKQDVYKIMKETSKVSRDAIDMFYGDYSPKYYQRVFGLKNLFNIDLGETDDGYTLKFTYSFSNVSGHANPSIIFSGPFIQGFHGGPIPEYEYEIDERGKHVVSNINYNPAPQMAPSPWDLIEEFANNIGGIIK